MLKTRYIDAVFEREAEGKDYTRHALLLQDLLRYSLIINKSPSENNPFKKRQLYDWLVRNNREIVDYYHEKKHNTTYSNRIHAREERLDNNLEILLQLNLIRKIGLAPAEKIAAPVDLFRYTKGGILLTLILKSLSMKEEMANIRRQDKLTEHKNQLDRIYQDIFGLIDSALTKVESSASDIFYSTLYRKCKERGIFYKVVERIHYVINSNNKIVDMIDLFYRAVNAFIDKRLGTELLDTYYETIEDLDKPVKNLFLYRMKLLAESRFENKQENFSSGDESKRYEQFRFDLRSDFERIAVQGYCKYCNSKQNVALHYLDLKKASYSDNHDIRVDCPACNTGDSILIPNFYY